MQTPTELFKHSVDFDHSHEMNPELKLRHLLGIILEAAGDIPSNRSYDVLVQCYQTIKQKQFFLLIFLICERVKPSKTTADGSVSSRGLSRGDLNVVT